MEPTSYFSKGRKAKELAKKSLKNNGLEFLEDEHIQAKRKPGRKKIDDEEYYNISKDKIQEWEELIKHPKGLSKNDVKMIRNRISA